MGLSEAIIKALRGGERWLAVFAVFLIAAFPLCANVYLSPPDSCSYYCYTRSLLLDGDLSFFNEYQRFEYPPNTFHLVGTPGKVRLSNDWPAGCGLAWMPPFAVAHGLARVFGWLQAPPKAPPQEPSSAPAANSDSAGFWAPDGYSGVYRLAINVWCSLLAAAGLFFSARLAQRLWGARAAGGALWLVFLGTPMVFYFFYFAMMSHLTSFFFVSAFLAYWAETIGRRDAWRFLWLGVLGGWAAMTRTQNAIFLIAPATEMIAGWWRSRGGKAPLAPAGQMDRVDGMDLRDAPAQLEPPAQLGPPGWLGLGLRNAALGAVALGVAFAPQMLIWRKIYGSAFRSPQVEGMRWLRPALGEMFLSDYHGILTWSPVFLFVTLGLFLLWKRDRLIGAAFILSLAAQTWINAASEAWWAGGSFGNRRFVDYSLIYIVAMAGWLAHPLSRRLWVKGVMAAFVAWNLLLVAMERGGALTLEHYVAFDAKFFAAVAQALASPWPRLAAPLAGDVGGAGAAGRLLAGLVLGAGAAALFAFVFGLARERWRKRAMMAGLGSLAVATAGALAVVGAARCEPMDWPQERIEKWDLAFHNRMLWENIYEYGYYCVKKGRDAEAQKAFRRAFILWPRRMQPLRYIARYELLQGRPTRSLLLARFILYQMNDYQAAWEVYRETASQLLQEQADNVQLYALLLRDADQLKDPRLRDETEAAWRERFFPAPMPDPAAPGLLPPAPEEIIEDVFSVPYETLRRGNLLLGEAEFQEFQRRAGQGQFRLEIQAPEDGNEAPYKLPDAAGGQSDREGPIS